MNVRLPVDRFKSLLASLNGDGRYGIALLLISILLLLPEVSGDAARSALRYDRTAIEAGQWWRFVTAHVVHLDLEHALLNVLGFVMMWALFARDYPPKHWLVIVASIVLFIGAGLWFWDTRIHWYVGASGALHGFMAAGTIAHLRRGDLDGWILAIFIVLKLGYEQVSGSLPFMESDVPVVLNAHLYGALGGAIPAAFLKPRADSL
jgi:rhomboid family GlyGly-CTERM serine protease